jgi:RHH-type proline utilization regulon transcriptional repressor/proline dehydrogenase/delta 1-pyrroline-5-carboxylate dehydrogenase
VQRFDLSSERQPDRGTFVEPTLIEIDRIEQLEREVFGPVLHVLRYRREDLDGLVDGINALGYGLTMGVHSRVDGKIERVMRRAHAGNIYVNRNIVGAVVGVQPFGGEGLSGTGPKAGGPLYMYRLLSKSPAGAALAELNAAAEVCDESPLQVRHFDALEVLRDWAMRSMPDLAVLCDRMASLSPAGSTVTLPGPTGESNSYTVLPREAILCLASTERDLLAQLALVLAIGASALWPKGVLAQSTLKHLPSPVKNAVRLIDDWTAANGVFDAVIQHGPPQERIDVARKIAAREGPIVTVHSFDPGEPPFAVERLLVERVVSVNTAAAGGNASLMTVG